MKINKTVTITIILSAICMGLIFSGVFRKLEYMTYVHNGTRITFYRDFREKTTNTIEKTEGEPLVEADDSIPEPGMRDDAMDEALERFDRQESPVDEDSEKMNIGIGIGVSVLILFLILFAYYKLRR